MKRYVPPLAFLCVFLISLSPAAATIDQGLDWGYAVGDRFDFHSIYTDFTNPIYSKTYDFYFEVASLPAISNNITEVGGIPYLDIDIEVDYYFANDTSLGHWADLLPGLVLPIGNWTLWTTLFEEVENHEWADYSLIDTSESNTTWSYSSSYGGDGMAGEDGMATYLKADGVLTYFHWTGHNDGGNRIYEYEISRVGYEPLSPLLIVGLVGVGIVIVAAIVIFAKKR